MSETLYQIRATVSLGAFSATLERQGRDLERLTMEEGVKVLKLIRKMRPKRSRGFGGMTIELCVERIEVPVPAHIPLPSLRNLNPTHHFSA